MIEWLPVPHPAISASGALSSRIGVKDPNGKEPRNSRLKYSTVICFRQFHPARVGILFILTCALLRTPPAVIGVRHLIPARSACSSNGSINLLAQDCVNRSGVI